MHKSALFHFRVQGREICPKMGAPTVFNEVEEKRMHEFLLDAWFLRIPRSSDEFALDIKFMLDYDRKKTRFTDNKPGNK